MVDGSTLSKKLVVKHENGMMQIIGDTDVQPADMIEGENGQLFNLVALKHCLYYLYKPVIAPITGMKSFNPSQR